jgi:hypothetical protein
VAVDRRERARWSSLVARHPRASRIGADGTNGTDGWELYRIGQAPPAASIAGRRPVPVAQVRATAHPESVARLLDGDVSTAWSSGMPQAGNEAIELDLGREVEGAALVLDLAALFPEFPRRLEVDCATTPDGWRPCWRGSSAALLLDGTLADARNPTMTIAIDAERVRWIRLRQTGRDGTFQWSIAEVFAFAR